MDTVEVTYGSMGILRSSLLVAGEAGKPSQLHDTGLLCSRQISAGEPGETSLSALLAPLGPYHIPAIQGKGLS